MVHPLSIQYNKGGSCEEVFPMSFVVHLRGERRTFGGTADSLAMSISVFDSTSVGLGGEFPTQLADLSSDGVKQSKWRDWAGRAPEKRETL